jgi:hypothetical protein
MSLVVTIDHLVWVPILGRCIEELPESIDVLFEMESKTYYNRMSLE